MDKKHLFMKNLVFAILVLFIGASVIPGVGGNDRSIIYVDEDYERCVEGNDEHDSWSNQTYHSTTKGAYDFVIIANSTFYEYDGTWDLRRLRDWHNQNDTLHTYIVNLSTIYTNPSFWVNGTWGDGNPDNPFNRTDENAVTNYEMFNDSAAKIRNYIRYAHHDLGVRYALLAGDTDSNGEGFFPVRYVYSRSIGAPAVRLQTYHGIIPTDVYYACLNGTFNADEDENSASFYTGWGENATESSEGIEECDWSWEVAVGRFSVDDNDQLSNAIRKTIAYMSLTGDEPYLRNISLGGTRGGWGGQAEWACNYSKILNGTTYSNWWNAETTYGFNSQIYTISVFDDNPDREEGVDFLDKNVAYSFNSGCHIWVQNGHGSSSGWSGGYGESWVIDDIQGLINTEYCLILSSIPCNTAGFDYSDDCFIEQWLTDDYGAFAALGNTRYGWGSYDGVGGIYDGLNASSAYLGVQILDAYFHESYTRLGDMVFDSKLDGRYWHDSKGDGSIRWAMYEQILMGSPAVTMKLAGAPTPPIANFTYTPTYPKPKDVIQFTDTSYDPDGKIISWLWDFDDGNFSDLQNTSHTYYVEGVFNVTLTVTDNDSLIDAIQKTIVVDTPADFDDDGDVDLDDFANFAQCYGGASSPPSIACPSEMFEGGFCRADFDHDGDVDLDDFAVFAQCFGGTSNPPNC